MAPKMRRNRPPAIPVDNLTIGLPAISVANSPKTKASRRTSGNSTKVCPIEKARPPLAPDRVPWETVAKKRGPGAKAPEAVTSTTVAMKVSSSIRLQKLS